MNFSKRILFLIEQAGTLLQMPRSHVRNLGNAYDTVASHSHHVSIIAYCIARMEGLSHDDGMRALAMGAFHDLAEARIADLDFISKNYTTDDEPRAIQDQFKDITFGPDLERLLEECNERKTAVAQCTRDADLLAQMYHEWTLVWRGNKLAEQWFETDFQTRVPYFHTKSAKKLAHAMKESNPNEWWWSELVTKDGKPKTQEHLLGKGYSNKQKT